MLSGILNSDRAIEVNIMIMRAFLKLREMLASNKNSAKRLDDLERKSDAQFRVFLRPSGSSWPRRSTIERRSAFWPGSPDK